MFAQAFELGKFHVLTRDDHFCFFLHLFLKFLRFHLQVFEYPDDFSVDESSDMVLVEKSVTVAKVVDSNSRADSKGAAVWVLVGAENMNISVNLEKSLDSFSQKLLWFFFYFFYVFRKIYSECVRLESNE